MTELKKIRTRLSPEVRKHLLLDRAADLVAAEGVSAFNMERLGKEAGVSKSFVYAYYPSMKELLQTLLKREYKRLRTLQNSATESAETFEQLVRRVTTIYLTYMEQRGLMLERLAAEPSLEDHVDPTEYSRATAGHYLIKHQANRQTIEDITVTMIIGSVEALKQKYETALKPLVRKPII
ncbi:MAG: helix-turn-helix domain-containing protein [Paraglaciecola polaris]|mgnify:FL=1|uniref:TetR/AcrR family transcriptional regulator n=1 Tax=Paraglaciecola polaris TaxID=222814 RepID=UPI003001CB5F